MAQKVAGKTLTVIGDGIQTRDFTLVTGVVEAFVQVADSEINGKVLNVGSGDSYSINRLFELLRRGATYIPKWRSSLIVHSLTPGKSTSCRTGNHVFSLRRESLSCERTWFTGVTLLSSTQNRFRKLPRTGSPNSARNRRE